MRKSSDPPSGPDPAPAQPAKPAAGARSDRLKAALRSNLSRRKAQARARGTGAEPPDRDDPQT